MFITIGFIVGFVAGWFVNDKFDALKKMAKKLKFWKK